MFGSTVPFLTPHPATSDPDWPLVAAESPTRAHDRVAEGEKQNSGAVPVMSTGFCTAPGESRPSMTVSGDGWRYFSGSSDGRLAAIAAWRYFSAASAACGKVLLKYSCRILWHFSRSASLARQSSPSFGRCAFSDLICPRCAQAHSKDDAAMTRGGNANALYCDGGGGRAREVGTRLEDGSEEREGRRGRVGSGRGGGCATTREAQETRRAPHNRTYQ